MRAPEKDETAGPKESLRKLDELDQVRSERSSGSIFSGTSKMTGRCDTTTYAEAMQSVADLTDVVSVKNAQNRRATNQIEAFLLTDIEESSESGRSDSMGRIHIGLAPRSARGPATDAATAEAPGPPLSEEDKKGGHGSDEWHSREELGGEDDERPPGLHRWLLRRFFITSVVGLLMLAPSIATIVLYASDPVYDEELDLDGELPPKPPFANATTEQIFLLILRPVYALAAAYSTSLVLAAFFKNAKVQRWMPGFVLLFMHHTFHLGWALPAMLYPAAIGIFYRVGVDGDAWSFLVELMRFLATAVWLMAGGLSSAVLDSGVALLQRQLTLHHYEQRSQTAYDTQRCLRKIVAAAHAAERHAEKVRETRAVEAAAGVLQMRMRQFAQRVARERGPRRSSRTSGNSARSATAPPASADRPSDLSCSRDEVLPSDVQVRIVQSRSEHGHIEKSLAPPSRSASKAMLNTDAPTPEPGRLATPHPPKEPPRADTRAKELDRQLDILSGPLDLGPGITAARTFSQAGRRAVKIFRVLMAQEELRVPQVDGQEPAVDRDKLVLWAFRDGGRKSSSRLAGSVFRYGPAITMDEFIKVVEESYQEQRLITASVAAFDRLHSEVRVFLQVVLLFVFLILLLAVWSVSVVTWLVPIGSALLSAAVLAGRITSDILDCFFFAYIIRPYDIGDRVAIALEGHPPSLLPCLIKDVFLMRTHFYSANGDLMMVANSSLRKMAITNFSRSGPLTIMVELMVPATAPTAKLTELLDAIGSYVKGSDEWSAADIQFFSVHTNEGYMMLRIWATCRYKAEDLPQIMDAKSRMLLFCHSYMQSAGIEFIQPIMPIRPDMGKTADPTALSSPLAGFFPSRPGP